MASDNSLASAEHRNTVGAQDHQHQKQEHQEANNQELDLDFPLMRQSSLYSLTLDEIQNTVCEPGKTFGSMNMDEFLANIWSAEEGHAAAAVDPAHATAAAGGYPPLCRQGSIAIPAPLSGKTVDEVWANIHREQPVHHHTHHNGNGQTAARQPTFGEMTLEDFLVKAGVVREGHPSCAATPLPQTPATAQHLPQQFGLLEFQLESEAPAGFGHEVGAAYGDRQNFGSAANGVYLGGVGRMGSGYGAAQRMGMVGSPMSPVSSDGGMMAMQVENTGPYRARADVEGARGGRKRLADGTVEVVVERRQRRMIKNRESAARSRARKQAYTVELEAEINQLRESITQLKEEEQRKQQKFEQTMEEVAQGKAMAMKARGTLRRCYSCLW